MCATICAMETEECSIGVCVHVCMHVYTMPVILDVNKGKGTPSASELQKIHERGLILRYSVARALSSCTSLYIVWIEWHALIKTRWTFAFVFLLSLQIYVARSEI